MIHKNVTMGDHKPVTVVEFGHGTVGMITAEQETGEKLLLLKTQDPKPIGSFAEPHGCEFGDEWKPEIALSFANVESLDAVMETLAEIKKQFNPKTEK